MDTGEDSRGLRKIVDFTHLLSIFILAIHFYIACFGAFEHWGWTAPITTRLVTNIARTGLFHSVMKPKLAALLLLLISLVAAKGRKEENVNVRNLIIMMVAGLAIYLASPWCFKLSASPETISVAYIGLSITGYLLIMSGGTQLSRLIKGNFEKDIFNTDNESFPQVGDDGNGDESKWYAYTHPDDPNGDNEGIFDGIGNSVKFWMDKNSYKFKNDVKKWLSEVLEIIYAAAALCINTIRTFFLLVLAILGPLVFGLSVFDGLQHSLQQWVARYINIFLWLPIANIFGSIIGKVQENMLKLDISQIQSNGDTFFSSQDTAYIIFLLIGIVGYFSVPTVANFVVHAHGGNGLLYRVTSMTMGGSNLAMQSSLATTEVVGSRAANGALNLLTAPGDFIEGYQSGGNKHNQHQHDHISGKEKQ